jgi:hypothetical protein
LVILILGRWETMRAKKTIQDYESEIRQLHSDLENYSYFPKIQEKYPKGIEEISNKLSNRLTTWSALVEVVVFVANNEQEPLSSEELEYKTLPMLTKKEYGKMFGEENAVKQVADYQAFIKFGSRSEWCTTLFERKGGKKGCEDFYSTLMNQKGRERFYGEIGRYKADKRFKRMIVLVESSFPELMSYVPLFCGKKRNTDHIGACAESRYGTVASLFIQDVPVLFCGTRFITGKMVHKLIQQDIVKNYVYYLQLDKEEENKIIGEDEKTLSFEVEGMKFKVLKIAVEVLT